jgi:hypothetical protein
VAWGGELAELDLGLRLGDAGERPHLGIGELAALELLPDQRKLREGAGDPHVLPGRAGVEAAAPRHPFRERATAGLPPAAAAIELGHQRQPASVAGVHLRRQRLDLALDQLQGEVIERSAHGIEHTF